MPFNACRYIVATSPSVLLNKPSVAATQQCSVFQTFRFSEKILRRTKLSSFVQSSVGDDSTLGQRENLSKNSKLAKARRGNLWALMYYAGASES